MREGDDSLIWLVLAGSVAVLATVFVFQFALGLAPCELCLYERWPYYLALLLSIGALFVRREGFDPRWRQAAMVLCGMGFLAGAVLGAYHVGVEQHWWAGPAACTGRHGAATLQDLREQLMATPVVRCDQVAWSLFGISLAGFNVIAAAVLACLSAVAAARR